MVEASRNWLRSSAARPGRSDNGSSRPSVPGLVALGPLRSALWRGFSCLVQVIGRRSNRQHSADRPDSVDLTMLVDERHHHLPGRSSSAWAKYAEALRRISFARRSSRFSRSSVFKRSRSSLVRPGRAGPGHARPVGPICAGSQPCSRSSRRSRRSDETCLACGGAVRIIACIEDPEVIEKILTHLDAKGGAPEASCRLRCRAPPQTQLFD